MPFLVLVVDGKPDFRISDAERWAKAVRDRRCALCGEGLGRHIAFIGGPRSHASRAFTDPGMHYECAAYAMQVCPYLALPRMRRTAQHVAYEDVAIHTTEEVVEERPEVFFLGVSTDFEVEQFDSGSYYVRAAPWISVEWFRHGVPVPAPVDAPTDSAT